MTIDHPLREFMVMQPTFVSVNEELLRLALQVAEDAKESAAELLCIHDANLGRTTKKNLWEAQRLEGIIRQAGKLRQSLRDALGFSSLDVME